MPRRCCNVFEMMPQTNSHSIYLLLCRQSEVKAMQTTKIKIELPGPIKQIDARIVELDVSIVDEQIFTREFVQSVKKILGQHLTEELLMEKERDIRHELVRKQILIVD